MTGIAISSGHGLDIRGASGSPVPPQLDEVDEARRVVNRVAELLNQAGVDVDTFHDDASDSQSENLDRIVDWHNQQDRDLDVSVHFNAYDGSAQGVEVLYVTQEALADRVSSAIAEAGGFTNRGAKYRGDLAFLNGTEKPAILIETCFCDHTSDSNRYNEHFNEICEAIAETIGDVEISDRPPPVQPPEPENRVAILGAASRGTAIYINGRLVAGSVGDRHQVDMAIRISGDVTLAINGEEFNSQPTEAEEPKANHTNIICTQFGGQGDPNYSAYDPDLFLNDEDFYIALPWKFAGERPGVKVFNRANGTFAIGDILDVGPWVTDDEEYVLGDDRPLAEQCWKDDEPLPDGPNKGEVPNGAGIDLSPAMCRELGIDGKGKVDFLFLDEGNTR
jgi:hypothetical protein